MLKTFLSKLQKETKFTRVNKKVIKFVTHLVRCYLHDIGKLLLKSKRGILNV